MKTIGILAAGTAAALLSTAAQATPIVGSSTGLASPATTITFSEVSLAQSTQVTNQFAPFGLSFTAGSAWYSPETGYGHVQGSDVGNFDLTGNFSFAPLTLTFSSAQTSAAFAMDSNGSPYLFEALLGNTVVDSFTTHVGIGARDYFGFQGDHFDSIRISDLNSDYYLIDNVQLSSFGAVPEPAAWSVMLLGIGAIGAALRSRRKAIPAA